MTIFRRHCVNAILLLVQIVDNEDEPSSSDENVESHRLALHSRRRLPLLALFAAARVPVAIFRGLSRGRRGGGPESGWWRPDDGGCHVPANARGTFDNIMEHTVLYRNKANAKC